MRNIITLSRFVMVWKLLILPISSRVITHTEANISYDYPKCQWSNPEEYVQINNENQPELENG